MMMPPPHAVGAMADGTLLTVVGVLFGAIMTFLGVVYAARQSAKANARTVAVTARQADTQGFTSLIASLQAEVGRLAARVDALEKSGAADREALNASRAETAEAKAETAVEHRGRMEAVGFARDLVNILRHVAPDVPIPLAPPSVASHL